MQKQIFEKIEWTAEWRNEINYQLICPETIILLSSRPSWSVDPIFDGVKWLQGIKKCENIKITYNDVTNDEGGAIFAYWMDGQFLKSAEMADLILKLYIGGNVKVEWHLEKAAVISTNYSAWDYSKSQMRLDVTICYNNATFSQHNLSDIEVSSAI